jgi:hypothetical protein
MDSELLFSVAEQMLREQKLSQIGLGMLYSIHIDPYHECLYYSIALRLTEMYGEFVEQEGLDKTAYQRLRKNAVTAFVRFYTLKKQLTLDEARRCHAATNEAFTIR